MTPGWYQCLYQEVIPDTLQKSFLPWCPSRRCQRVPPWELGSVMQNSLFQNSFSHFFTLIRWTVTKSHHCASLTGLSFDPKLWTLSQTVVCPTEGLAYFWATPSPPSFLPHPLLDLFSLKTLYPPIAITYLFELSHHSSVIGMML